MKGKCENCKSKVGYDELHLDTIKNKKGLFCDDCLYQYDCYIDEQIENRRLKNDDKDN